MSDRISEVLDLVPMPEVVRSPEVELYVDDYEYAKNNMKEIIETGKNALNELADIANKSEHPRAYEVLTMHIKNMIDAQKSLLDLKKLNGQITEVNNTQINQNKVQNNSIIVGSTADLQKILKELTKEK